MDNLVSLIASLQALVVALSTQVAVLQQTAAVSTVAVKAPSSQVTPLDFTAINNLYRDAVVNIICSGQSGIKSSTASGVIISPNGVVLANAHIAQYLLLEQYSDAPVSCIIRTGSPAQVAYKAEVLYIPPHWVATYGDQIDDEEQTGTGKGDYALLHITERVDGTPLPATFTALPIDTSPASLEYNRAVLIRAYPAEFVGPYIALQALYPAATIASIHELATFKPEGAVGTPDLMSLGGSIVAQGGSSGGAVISDTATLIGLVVTSTRSASTAERNLRATSIAYINDDLVQASGIGLPEFINSPLHSLREHFTDSLRNETQVLLQYI